MRPSFISFIIRTFALMLVALAGIVAGGAVPAQASLPPARASVYPAAGSPGTVFFFSASSFRSERVGYWFNAPDGSVYSNKYEYAAYAYDSSIDWRWQVPYDAPPGMWTAVAQGEESGLQQIIPFEVLSADGEQPANPSMPLPQGSPNVSVEPQVAPPGTNIAFTASGLDGERAGYWFTDPAGNIHGDDVRYWFKIELSPFTWHWKSPDDAMPGVWTMHVRGAESGIEYEQYFEIRRPPDTPPPGTTPVNPPCLGAVEPRVGYPNTEFRFFATGFPPRADVRYWAEDPNGRNYDYDEALTIGSNPDGRVDIRWEAPDTAAYGFWTMHFLSEQIGETPSHIERKIYFEVRNPANPVPPEGEYMPPPPCQPGSGAP
jgi:hypothetical protein